MDYIRFDPDKQSYEQAMQKFSETLFVAQPRSLATTKVALTTAASRSFTQHYGVEWNLLMTKVNREERVLFGFDGKPWKRHFAIKIYGKVYEFGPWPEKIRKTLFLDWCLNYLDFEFAPVIDRMNINGFISEQRRPVAAFTMKSEEELDGQVEKYLHCLETQKLKYDPEILTSFIFVKVAQMFLNPADTPYSEMSQWITKCAEYLGPTMRRNILNIHKKRHYFAGRHGVGIRIAEIELLDTDGEMDDDEDSTGDTTNPSSRAISDSESNIEVIELD